MHARHRSPSDGVRSNSGGMYNSEYRSFNRGFGRGLPRPYPPPPPPPPPALSRTADDIFMQAGRLATEYLVSRGVLPPNVLPPNSLPGKWQNGSFQDFRMQDRERLPPATEGRNSSYGRLGNVGPEGGLGRRRFSDEFNSMGPRNRVRGRKRNGHFRGYGPDWGRENGRGSPWSEQTRGFPDMEGEDEFAGGYYRDQKPGFDGWGRVSKFVGNEQSSKDEIGPESESELETYEFPSDAGSKVSSSSTHKDLPCETNANSNKVPNDPMVPSSETGEMKGTTDRDEMEKETVTENFDKKDFAVEDDPEGKNGDDLLQMPPKVHSSSTSESSKVDEGPAAEEKSTCKVAPETGKISEVDSIDSSKADSLKNPLSNLQSSGADISVVTSVDEAGKSDPPSIVESELCTGPQSLIDRSFMNQEPNDGPPGFGTGRSVLVSNEGGSSGQYESECMKDGTKRPREWSASEALHNDEYFQLRNTRSKQTRPDFERLSPDVVMAEAVEQDPMVESAASSPKASTEPGMESREEKQLLPGSFKICDLNLTDASEITENPHDLVQNHVSVDSSALQVEKEAPGEVCLSINNNFGGNDTYNGCSNDAKEVPVIDIPDDPVMEDRGFCAAEPKTDPIYSSIESFLNHTENTVDLADVQDGYGHAISEFLGTDISSCSSVPTGITGLQTDMSLHNQEGILADDDPIYLSLGEIPISFLGVWDQPPQEYGKPF